MSLNAILLEFSRLAHVVLDVRNQLRDVDLKAVLGLAGALTNCNPLKRLAVVLDHCRGRHPVLRLVATAVGVNHHRAVVFQHHQAQRLGQDGVEAAGVNNFAAGNEQAH